MARLAALPTPWPQARAAIAAATAALVPADRPGDFAQALMDLGAMVCRPRNPDCAACPLSADCAAALAGEARILSAPRRRQGAAGPLRRRLFRRPGATAPSSPAAGRPKACSARRSNCRGRHGGRPKTAARARRAPFAARWRRLPGEVEQVFTHFALRLTVYVATIDRLPGDAGDLFWVAAADAASAGFSSVMLKAIAHARRRLCETRAASASGAAALAQ